MMLGVGVQLGAAPVLTEFINNANNPQGTTTWNVVETDSNKLDVEGPNQFLSGTVVCNLAANGADAPALGVYATFVWDEALSFPWSQNQGVRSTTGEGPYVDITPGEANPGPTVDIPVDGCRWWGFSLDLSRDPAA